MLSCGGTEGGALSFDGSGSGTGSGATSALPLPESDESDGSGALGLPQGGRPTVSEPYPGDSGANKPVNVARWRPTIPARMAGMVDGSLTTDPVDFGRSGFFVIDLGQPTLLGRAIFSQVAGNAFAQAIAFAASDDLQTWTEIWKGTSPNDFYMFLEAEVEFAATRARYFKVSYEEPFNDGFILADEIALFAPGTSSSNLALGKPAIASVHTKGQSPSVRPSALTDGQLGGAPWIGTSKPGFIEVDLGESLLINRVRLSSDTHYATTSTYFEVSNDGLTWTTAVGGAGAGVHDITFPPVMSRYVRCRVLAVSLSDQHAPGLVARELQVYGP